MCAVLHGFDLPEPEAMGLILGWNHACTPPWQGRHLDKMLGKVRHDTRYGRGYMLRLTRGQTLSCIDWAAFTAECQTDGH
jgi:hypothetical protein